MSVSVTFGFWLSAAPTGRPTCKEILPSVQSEIYTQQDPSPGEAWVVLHPVVSSLIIKSGGFVPAHGRPERYPKPWPTMVSGRGGCQELTSVWVSWLKICTQGFGLAVVSWSWQ